MLSDLEREQRIQSQQKKICEQEIKSEKLDKDIDALFKEAQVSPEKLSAYLSDKKNFSEEQWSALSQEKKKLDQKLERDLANIRDPNKAKKAYSSLRIAQHWLHVR
jgi:hypothetical protein